MDTSARVHGLKLIAAAGGLCAALIGLVFLLARMGYTPGMGAMVGLAVPFVPLLGGMVEVVTGISFFDLARRWDGLKGWQRGVYGTSIVVLALFSVVAGVAGFFTLLDCARR